MSDLPEIAERDATGRVAELYADIRAVVGAPFVALIYRVLAANGGLEAAWASLRPNLADPATAPAAAELVRVGVGDDGVRIPTAALRAAGVDDADLPALRSTCAAYDHTNSRNLLAVTALLHADGDAAPALPGPDAGADEPPAAPAFDLVPMVPLAGLAQATRALLDELSRPLVLPGDAALVPSLFRHFADRPCLLALLATALEPARASGAVEARGAAVEARARELAAALPHAVAPVADPAVRAVLERFGFTISRMIVVGGLLGRALDAEP
ncbi:MAG: hypothetical protein R3C15_08830 [Thermoleophilia bacterium]